MLEMKRKCSQNLDLDSRDEGTEYEGECSVLSLINNGGIKKQVSAEIVSDEVRF